MNLKTRPTRPQTELAKRLGVSIAGYTVGEAMALLRDEVAEAIGDYPAVPSSESQRLLAARLGIDVLNVSMRVASARIAERFMKRNSDDVAVLSIQPGDRVQLLAPINLRSKRRRSAFPEFTVSSVGANGRIYFRGGRARSAWPHEIQRCDN